MMLYDQNVDKALTCNSWELSLTIISLKRSISPCNHILFGLNWLEWCSLGKIMRRTKQRDVSGWREGGDGKSVRRSQNERRKSEMQPDGHLVFFLYVEEINRRAYIVSSAGL